MCDKCGSTDSVLMGILADVIKEAIKDESIHAVDFNIGTLIESFQVMADNCNKVVRYLNDSSKSEIDKLNLSAKCLFDISRIAEINRVTVVRKYEEAVDKAAEQAKNN